MVLPERQGKEGTGQAAERGSERNVEKTDTKEKNTGVLFLGKGVGRNEE